VAWSTGLGYGAATLFYQLATIGRHPAQSLWWAALVLLAFTSAVYGFYRAGNKQQKLSNVQRLV
jgi:ferrous iron transport protein B